MTHTPVLPVYDGKGYKRKTIARVCGHCGLVLTPAGNPSSPTHLIQHRFAAPKVVRNERHRRRTILARRTRRLWKWGLA